VKMRVRVRDEGDVTGWLKSFESDTY